MADFVRSGDRKRCFTPGVQGHLLSLGHGIETGNILAEEMVFQWEHHLEMILVMLAKSGTKRMVETLMG